MYIIGRISTKNEFVDALPEKAIVGDGGDSYIFVSEKTDAGWLFTPLKVITGQKEGGWTEIKLLSPIDRGTKVAWNAAYYLLSEMKKSETGDDD
jgi:cobalt-zinc-cadmium efflux system membrane fusion protein